MIRALAVGLAIAAQRLFFVPALFIVEDPTFAQIATLSSAAFIAAFVLHVSFAEAWIRLTRRRGRPQGLGGERPPIDRSGESANVQ